MPPKIDYQPGQIIQVLQIVKEVDSVLVGVKQPGPNNRLRNPQNNFSRRFLCKCLKCGELITRSLQSLRAYEKGRQVSTGCGCMKSEVLAKTHLTHGLSYHPLYQRWVAMKGRCRNPNNGSYYLYGGRGITICSRWEKSFENFLEDMGERPSKDFHLDRINPEEGYSKENCQWAPNSKMNYNKREKVFKSELDSMASELLAAHFLIGILSASKEDTP